LISHVEAADATNCYVALSVLRGVVPPGLRTRKLDRAGVLRACDVIRDQLPARHAKAVVIALSHPLDNMSCACFPAFRLGQKADVKAVLDVLTPSVWVVGYRGEAYDQHERLGRRAIRLFVRDILMRSDVLVGLAGRAEQGAVADAVFVEEGQQLHWWASNPVLDVLRRNADELTVTRHGLSASRALMLREIVKQAIPDLNAHRAAIAGQASDHASGNSYP